MTAAKDKVAAAGVGFLELGVGVLSWPSLENTLKALNPKPEWLEGLTRARAREVSEKGDQLRGVYVRQSRRLLPTVLALSFLLRKTETKKNKEAKSAGRKKENGGNKIPFREYKWYLIPPT